ncbi:MAG: hypothetical protein OXP73_10730 [Chloroflexota bacterium]|nr:hypothetical protein [Chloroflexota bacterium]
MTVELHALETERRLSRIDAMAASVATKADLHALETRLIKWMVGSVLAAAMFAGTIASVIGRFWT